jgi:hypothetical protein
MAGRMTPPVKLIVIVIVIIVVIVITLEPRPQPDPGGIPGDVAVERVPHGLRNAANGRNKNACDHDEDKAAITEPVSEQHHFLLSPDHPTFLLLTRTARGIEDAVPVGAVASMLSATPAAHRMPPWRVRTGLENVCGLLMRPDRFQSLILARLNRKPLRWNGIGILPVS